MQSFYERNVVGDLMARATSDLNAVSMTASYGILTLSGFCLLFNFYFIYDDGYY